METEENAPPVNRFSGASYQEEFRLY
ncbi:uncharacterized protein METZ01_LOCUS420668, partial [marine metagenome]